MTESDKKKLLDDIKERFKEEMLKTNNYKNMFIGRKGEKKGGTLRCPYSLQFAMARLKEICDDSIN